MIVTTGCPRSGTSLMMQCLAAALGKDRMFGEKFPMIAVRERFEAKRDDETDEQHAYRLYTRRVTMGHNDVENDYMATTLNPKGFWECPFTVAGVKWDASIEEQCDELLAEDAGKESFCKIVSHGVAQSDPRFISKIVLMMRDPRSVAKSQERLIRSFPYFDQEGGRRNLFDNMQIHSPKMFIDVSLSLAGWLKRHTEVPVHVVQYDELVDEPEATLEKVFKFLGESKPKVKAKAAAEVIDPELRRSYPEEDKPSLLWDDAELVHEKLAALDYDELETFTADKTRKSYREDASWPCVRSGVQMVEAHCKSCYTRPEFARSLRKASEKNRIDWQVMPCAWEVAYRTDGEPLISIDDSIMKNHWWTEDDGKREEWEISRIEMLQKQKMKEQVLKENKEKYKAPE